MKLFNSKLLARLLALLLALCMVTCCFAACSDSDRDRDDDDEKDSDRKDKDDEEEEDEDLQKFELNGLTYYLSEDFGGNESGEADVATHYSDNLTVEIACGTMDDVADSSYNIETSKDFAQYFEDSVGEYYAGVTVDAKNDIYYVTAEEDGMAMVCGFYIQDGYGWILLVTSEEEADLDAMIKIATSGKIDKNFDASDYISTDWDDDDTTSSYDTFTLHAYIPDAWGYPACWAWSNTSGENVFDAWPGEYMVWEEGYHYTMEIPTWAEYIIVNGNDGSVQTQDEPVEYGSDIWVVVNQSGDEYEVFFSEPSAEVLSDYGY